MVFYHSSLKTTDIDKYNYILIYPAGASDLRKYLLFKNTSTTRL